MCEAKCSKRVSPYHLEKKIRTFSEVVDFRRLNCISSNMFCWSLPWSAFILTKHV